ncbi:hypothetical protein CVT25_015601, partial [Psilocybe cyanescens]
MANADLRLAHSRSSEISHAQSHIDRPAATFSPVQSDTNGQNPLGNPDAAKHSQDSSRSNTLTLTQPPTHSSLVYSHFSSSNPRTKETSFPNHSQPDKVIPSHIHTPSPAFSSIDKPGSYTNGSPVHSRISSSNSRTKETSLHNHSQPNKVVPSH